MKLSRIIWASVVLLPLLSVEDVDSQGFSTGLILLGLIGGIFLGQMGVVAFMMFLMAVVPSDEARSLTHLSRSKRSLEAEVPALANHTYLPLKTSENDPGNERTSRFISNLLKSDPLNCMPQVMCELGLAEEPSTKTDTLNDYKFLMNELLSDEDDETGHRDTKFRSDSNKNYRSKQKKKPIKKGNDDDSSPEYDSEEIRPKGAPPKDAEMMQLEEEDGIEEKAWQELIAEDPADIGYALADMKKKEKIQGMVHQGKFDVKEPNPYEYGYLGANSYSFKRNLELLEKTLGESATQGIFRTSRTFQESFIHRKERELKQTNDIFDRVRIAAEVANVTRSARQCRALFDDCPIPMGNSGRTGLNKVVNNIRKIFVGKKTPSNRYKAGNMGTADRINLGNLQALVNRIQQPVGGTDVKLTLNIGNDPYRMGMMSYPYYANPAIPNGVAPVTQQPNPQTTNAPTIKVNTHIFETDSVHQVLRTTAASVQSHGDTISATAPGSPEDTATLASDYPMDSNTDSSPVLEEIKPQDDLIFDEDPVEPAKPEEIQLDYQAEPIVRLDEAVVNRDVPKLKTKKAKPSKISTKVTKSPTKVDYKDRIQEASLLIKDLQKAASKPGYKVPMVQNPVYSKVHKQLEELIHVIDPKGKIKSKSEDSDSEESEESSEEVKPIKRGKQRSTKVATKATKRGNSKTTKLETPPPVKRGKSKPTKVTSKPVQRGKAKSTKLWSRPTENYPHQPQPQQSNRNQQTSWIGSVYDLFFKDKQTVPLPKKREEYIPSAQRHAYGSELRLGAGPSYYPEYPNRRINNFGRMDPYQNNYYNNPPRYRSFARRIFMTK